MWFKNEISIKQSSFGSGLLMSRQGPELMGLLGFVRRSNMNFCSQLQERLGHPTVDITSQLWPQIQGYQLLIYGDGKLLFYVFIIHLGRNDRNTLPWTLCVCLHTVVGV